MAILDGKFTLLHDDRIKILNRKVSLRTIYNIQVPGSWHLDFQYAVYYYDKIIENLKKGEEGSLFEIYIEYPDAFKVPYFYYKGPKVESEENEADTKKLFYSKLT
jgi:hypothetical protein